MTEQEMNEHIEEQAPAWFDTNYCTRYDIAAIQQGGCASGAYMPAVTYYQARQTMNEYGDDVLEYIEEQYGELPAPPAASSWSGIAVHYLSLAVELWASGFDVDNIEESEDDEE